MRSVVDYKSFQITSPSGNRAAQFLVRNATGGTQVWLVPDGGRVGIGTTTPNHKLDVCGTIRSHEWIVASFGCDFVFDENYSLPTFQQRKDFIKYNRHLMYIQSAKEMQEEGAQMAGTTMGLLRNVEEHELYLFKHDESITEQEEKIKSLEEENEDLRNDLKELILRVEKLEKE